MFLSQLNNLFKLRIGFIMMLTALVSMVATPNFSVKIYEMMALAFCVLIASASAGAFNQYYETDIDAKMKRTQNRPFVTGYFHKGPFWLGIILSLLLVAVVIANYVLNPMSAIFIFLGAFFYAIVYTVWLKRRTWMNIVIGGASGSFAVLAGAASVDPQLGPIPILFALMLFFWTPSHFWSLAMAVDKDYCAAEIPMLPALFGMQTAARVVFVNTVILVSLSLIPFFYGMGAIYLMGAMLGGGYFIYQNLLMLKSPTTAQSMQGFFASLIQLSFLLIGTVLDVIIRI